MCWRTITQCWARKSHFSVKTRSPMAYLVCSRRSPTLWGAWDVSGFGSWTPTWILASRGCEMHDSALCGVSVCLCVSYPPLYSARFVFCRYWAEVPDAPPLWMDNLFKLNSSSSSPLRVYLRVPRCYRSCPSSLAYGVLRYDAMQSAPSHGWTRSAV